MDALQGEPMLRRALQANGDVREVIRDDKALYFGSRINDLSLTPGPHAQIGATSLQSWLKGNAGMA